LRLRHERPERFFRSLVIDGGMSNDPGPSFMGKVKPREIGIPGFEQIHHFQRLGIVFEAPLVRHKGMKRVFPGMTKRGVAQVMGQGYSVSEILIGPQVLSHASGNLGHLKCMGESGSVMVPFIVSKNLCLVF